MGPIRLAVAEYLKILEMLKLFQKLNLTLQVIATEEGGSTDPIRSDCVSALRSMQALIEKVSAATESSMRITPLHALDAVTKSSKMKNVADRARGSLLCTSAELFLLERFILPLAPLLLRDLAPGDVLEFIPTPVTKH